MPRNDAAVVRRRGWHVAVARWMARWQLSLQVAFASMGLFLVFMPQLLPFWRDAVLRHDMTAWLHTEFASMGPWAMGWLLFLVFGPLLTLHFLAPYYTAGWNAHQQWGFPAPLQIVERQLYPRTPREEGLFWWAMCMDLLGTSLWLYLPFGVLAWTIQPVG